MPEGFLFALTLLRCERYSALTIWVAPPLATRFIKGVATVVAIPFHERLLPHRQWSLVFSVSFLWVLPMHVRASMR